MSNAYKVAILDHEQALKLIYGLAFVKTLVNKSKVSVDGVSAVGQATNASFGENFNQLQFKRWVKEESDYLLHQFQAACKKGPRSALEWLEGANKTRNQYFRNYQSVIEELNKINADLASAYLLSTRITATVQYAAETTLIVYGLIGGAANMTVNLAIKKFVLGVGSGTAVSIAEDWSSAKSADLLVTPATNMATNLPGTIDDTFRNILNLLNGWTISKLRKELAVIQEEIKKQVAHKNTLPKSGRAAAQTGIKALREEEKAIGSQLKNPGSKLGKLGSVFTILNWGLAIKAEADSTSKFLKHWNGEL